MCVPMIKSPRMSITFLLLGELLNHISKFCLFPDEINPPQKSYYFHILWVGLQEVDLLLEGKWESFSSVISLL